MESLTTENRITDGLRFLEDKNVRFAVVKLISCNGAESNSFIDARCGFEVLQEKNKVPSFLPFTVMFEKGVSFLKRLENANSEGIEQLQYTIKEALLCLDKFYETKGKNESSLRKVLDMRQDEKSAITETDITIAFAEHLLGKLAPGKSYTLDSRKEKKSCRCGCKKEPTYSCTGIGHELMWHGFVDIVFSSHQEIPAIANAVMEKEEITSVKLDEEEDEQNEISLDRGTKTEVKKHTLEQAFAQTIVFSLVQKQRHPDSLDHMVPNIVISPEKFEIVMYDADNDILLCSNSIFLFNLDLPENRTLTNEAVVILWMVLHYRIFCSGFNNASHEVLERCKSNFKKLVGSRWDIYSNSLKYCVSGFPFIKKWSVNELLRRGHQLHLY